MARSSGRFTNRSLHPAKRGFVPCNCSAIKRTLRWEEVYKYPEIILAQMKQLLQPVSSAERCEVP